MAGSSTTSGVMTGVWSMVSTAAGGGNGSEAMATGGSTTSWGFAGSFGVGTFFGTLGTTGLLNMLAQLFFVPSGMMLLFGSS